MRVAVKARLFRAPVSRGYSLVELLVVLSLMSVLLLSVGVTLHTLRKLNQQIQSELASSAILDRLSLMLRDDAHSANQCSIETSTGSDVVARFPRTNESVVIYETEPNRIVRKHRQGERQVQQEVFRLSHGNSVEWTTTTDPTQSVTLRIEQPWGKVSDGVRVYRVTATIGLMSGAR